MSSPFSFIFTGDIDITRTNGSIKSVVVFSKNSRRNRSKTRTCERDFTIYPETLVSCSLDYQIISSMGNKNKDDKRIYHGVQLTSLTCIHNEFCVMSHGGTSNMFWKLRYERDMKGKNTCNLPGHPNNFNHINHTT